MIKKNLQFAIMGFILSLWLCTIATAQTNPLIPSVDYPQEASERSKITLVKQLPQQHWTVLLGSVIRLILAVTGSLAFASFTVGGILMVTARGNDEQIAKGKKILLWSIGALAIIAVSYGIVVGVTQLKFFQ